MKILRNKNSEILKMLGIDDPNAGIDSVIQKIAELKQENRRLEGVLNATGEASLCGIFQKLVNSSSYYTRNKEVVDRVFSDVSKRDKLALMSADIIHNVRNDSQIHRVITDRFKRMGLSHAFVDEVSGKSIYIIGFNSRVSIDNIIKLLGFTVEQLNNSGHRVLLSFSREISDLSFVFEAYKDIKICRDYRCLGDASTILTIEKISMGNSLCLPVNFTDELKSLILEPDEEKIKKYISRIFETNIKKKIPLIKFEHLLRIMQNTFSEAVSIVKKDGAVSMELEQIFIYTIQNFRDTLDVDSLINSYVNILRFGLPAAKAKKSVLNRADVMKYINVHYSDDLYLEKMAAEFKTTPKYFSNYFKREFSVGFSEYLSNIRVSHAKQILSETSLPLGAVGEKVGYTNPVTFAVAFKKRVGMPPGKFREINRQ